MKTRNRSLLLAGLLTFASFIRAEEKQPVPERKIIYHGWNSPSTSYIREHWEEMEKMPFDGVGIRVAIDRSKPTEGDGATGNLLGWQTFGPVRFSTERFADAVADLQSPRWTRFTDNFLPVAIATRDQDHGLTWFDDARWATIEANWRVLIQVARDGKCRGIFLDPEHYDYECELFSYEHHNAQRTRATFAEYTAKSRERGRQLGTAMREIFPQIVVGLHYSYSLAAREKERYSLLPAFLDGMLAGTAPDASFVDLWEYGHGYVDAEDCDKAIVAIKKPTLTSEPELFRQMVHVGSSLRIDFAPRGKPWSPLTPEQNFFSPKRFGESLKRALRMSERYVWIYSAEPPRFFPPANLPVEYLAAMEDARLDPLPPDVPPGLFSVKKIGILVLAIAAVAGLRRFSRGPAR